MRIVVGIYILLDEVMGGAMLLLLICVVDGKVLCARSQRGPHRHSDVAICV